VNLPLDSIGLHPEQPRTTISVQEIDELADNLWIHGLLQPVVVTLEHDGSLLLLCGERRLLAFKRNRDRAAREPVTDSQDELAQRYNRWTEIPAVERPSMPAHERMMLQLVENDEREPLTLKDRAAGYLRAFELSGLSRREFCRTYGIPRLILDAYTACRAATGLARVALETSRINDAQAVAPFSKLPEDLQEALLRHAEATGSPISRPAILKQLEQLQEAARAGAEANKVPPLRKESAAPAEPPPTHPEVPVLSLSALDWLTGILAAYPAEDLGPDQTSLRRAAHSACVQALQEGSPYILLREDGFLPKNPRSSTESPQPN
jgi:ParB-like chromosome segregation protein Spo0J